MNSSLQANTAMCAAIWYNRRDARMENMPFPAEPSPDWVQIHIHRCGIYDFNLHEYLASPVLISMEAPHPLTGLEDWCILNHKFSGEIVRLGSGVTGFAFGQAIAVDTCQHRGTHYYYRHGLYSTCEGLVFTGPMNNGALVEYVSVPANLFYALLIGFPSETDALTEPLMVDIHTVEKVGGLLEQNIAMVGTGTTGLYIIMCARATGAV